MNDKVKVVSTVDAVIGIDIEDLKLKRTWSKKGAFNLINFDDLEQAIYDPGVEYMFQQGILYIDDMATKIRLGLEPEGAAEPENIFVLSEKEAARLITTAQSWEVKKAFEKMSKSQIEEFAHTAIALKCADMNKARIIQEACGIDIITAMRLKEQNEEPDNK